MHPHFRLHKDSLLTQSLLLLKRHFHFLHHSRAPTRACCVVDPRRLMFRPRMEHAGRSIRFEKF